jgi:putative ABC transport system ATP-binding protein
MTEAAAEPALLQADCVSREYQDGHVRALVDVSLSVRRGEFVAIVGPSGSGKSTLLNLLGALDRPTRGEVYFEGKPLADFGKLDQFRSQKLGFVFQSFHLIPVLTAIQNVQVPMFEGDKTADERLDTARQLLDTVGLTDRADHRPAQLSVGERQRVAIARALANEPQLLLADEPTGNLDTKTAAGIFELFQRLNGRGMTLVLVTHDPALAARASRVVHMRDGQIVDEKAPVKLAKPRRTNQDPTRGAAT